MGHVHLRVADIPATVAFYDDVLGFGLMARLGAQAAFLSAGGYHHHLGANTWESRGAPPAPPGTARLERATIVLPDAAARRPPRRQAEAPGSRRSRSRTAPSACATRPATRSCFRRRSGAERAAGPRAPCRTRGRRGSARAPRPGPRQQVHVRDAGLAPQRAGERLAAAARPHERAVVAAQRDHAAVGGDVAGGDRLADPEPERPGAPQRPGAAGVDAGGPAEVLGDDRERAAARVDEQRLRVVRAVGVAQRDPLGRDARRRPRAAR